MRSVVSHSPNGPSEPAGGVLPLTPSREAKAALETLGELRGQALLTPTQVFTAHFLVTAFLLEQTGYASKLLPNLDPERTRPVPKGISAQLLKQLETAWILTDNAPNTVDTPRRKLFREYSTRSALLAELADKVLLNPRSISSYISGLSTKGPSAPPPPLTKSTKTQLPTSSWDSGQWLNFLVRAAYEAVPALADMSLIRRTLGSQGKETQSFFTTRRANFAPLFAALRAAGRDSSSLECKYISGALVLNELRREVFEECAASPLKLQKTLEAANNMTVTIRPAETIDGLISSFVDLNRALILLGRADSAGSRFAQLEKEIFGEDKQAAFAFKSILFFKTRQLNEYDDLKSFPMWKKIAAKGINLLVERDFDGLKELVVDLSLLCPNCIPAWYRQAIGVEPLASLFNDSRLILAHALGYIDTESFQNRCQYSIGESDTAIMFASFIRDREIFMEEVATIRRADIAKATDNALRIIELNTSAIDESTLSPWPTIRREQEAASEMRRIQREKDVKAHCEEIKGKTFSVASADYDRPRPYYVYGLEQRTLEKYHYDRSTFPYEIVSVEELSQTLLKVKLLDADISSSIKDPEEHDGKISYFSPERVFTEFEKGYWQELL